MRKRKDTDGFWRILILDISGVYSQIYDEVYGYGSCEMNDLLAMYNADSQYACIVLENNSS